MIKIKKDIKKKKIIAIISLIRIGVMSISGCIDSQEKTIKVSGAFALDPMMGIWAEEYQ